MYYPTLFRNYMVVWSKHLLQTCFACCNSTSNDLISFQYFSRGKICHEFSTFSNFMEWNQKFITLCLEMLKSGKRRTLWKDLTLKQVWSECRLCLQETRNDHERQHRQKLYRIYSPILSQGSIFAFCMSYIFWKLSSKAFCLSLSWQSQSLSQSK